MFPGPVRQQLNDSSRIAILARVHFQWLLDALTREAGHKQNADCELETTRIQERQPQW